MVLAWMRTYSPWPAKIMRIYKTTAHLYFYGDHTNGTVALEKIGMLAENAHLIRFQAKMTIKNFREAVAEVELLKNVPTYLSMLRVNIN